MIRLPNWKLEVTFRSVCVHSRLAFNIGRSLFCVLCARHDCVFWYIRSICDNFLHNFLRKTIFVKNLYYLWKTQVVCHRATHEWASCSYYNACHQGKCICVDSLILMSQSLSYEREWSQVIIPLSYRFNNCKYISYTLIK